MSSPNNSKTLLHISTATLAERLCVTLYYLTTEDSQTRTSMSDRISPTKMGSIISETCQTLWAVLSKKGFSKALGLENEWINIATKSEDKWSFDVLIRRAWLKERFISNKIRLNPKWGKIQREWTVHWVIFVSLTNNWSVVAMTIRDLWNTHTNRYRNISPRQKYWVGVQRGQSYLMGRRCLFGLGWPPF